MRVVVLYAKLETAGVTQQSIDTLKGYKMLRHAQTADGFVIPATLSVPCPLLPQPTDYDKVFDVFMESALHELNMTFERAAGVRKEGEKKICLFFSFLS